MTIVNALSPLSSTLQRDGQARSGGWRGQPELFYYGADVVGGTLNMSPAWYQQGRGTRGDPPEVSSTLKAKNSGDGGREWLTLIRETNTLFAGAMAVMHPDLFWAGREAMIALSRQSTQKGFEEMGEVLPDWGTIFSSISVMVNQETPYHRDHNSPTDGFDLLATVGPYKGSEMSIPTLAQSFQYNPSTIMAFSGFLLRHGVAQVDGGRVCMAYYMRDKVLQWAGVPRPEFMHFQLLDGVGQVIKSPRIYKVPAQAGESSTMTM